MYIAIVDMDQPGIRRIIGISSGDDFSMAKFDSIQEVRDLKSEHALGVFVWWVLDIDDGMPITEI